jgi:hypothetical protein
MRGEQRGEDGSQFLFICPSSGNSRLAVYFTYHRVSGALEWTQLSQFTLTLPARERSKRIQTILVLAFIQFFCLRAYGCTGILGCALYGTRRRRNLRKNKSYELSRIGLRYRCGDAPLRCAVTPPAAVVPDFEPPVLGYVAYCVYK